MPEEPTPELVNAAQKLVGELMWLSTRTRPDVAFATGRCAQEILPHPSWVIEQATQVWKYLKSTPNEGLEFPPGKGEGWDGGPKSLEVYTDSSFAASPETQASHGAVMVLWNGALMFWKSGRQPFPALSTAESELLEAIEGLQTGDAVDSMIQEHEEPYVKTLFVDNLAATGFFSDGHANWRTRHLRLSSLENHHPRLASETHARHHHDCRPWYETTFESAHPGVERVDVHGSTKESG